MFTTVTITCSETRPDGQSASGAVSATLSEPIANGTEQADPTPVTGMLVGGVLMDASGERPFTLLATNDPATLPQGAVYSFVLELDSAPVDEFTAVVPYNAPLVNGVPTIDISVLRG